jgi:hypothetical protein
VRRLFNINNDGLWKDIVINLLQKYGGLLIFKCNINSTDVKKLNIKSSFWQDVLKAWAEIKYHEPVSVSEIANQIIWNNSNIKINGSTLFYQTWLDKDILKVKDICNINGAILTYAEFCQKYNFHPNYLIYYSITHSIPALWKDQLKTPHIDLGENSNIIDIADYVNNSNLTKHMYMLLTKSIERYPDHCRIKWIEKLGKDISKEDWNSKFQCINEATIYNTIRTLQYKFLHRIIWTGKKLFDTGLVESNICRFCNRDIETVEHAFWYCDLERSIFKYT